jgi:3-hydroxyisobutyrate dehydrogenase-like beta-hydroxyacid dehydrogenase
VSVNRYGFVGLGHMGAPMAANIAKGGWQLNVYDKAGTHARAPAGTTAATLAEIAKTATTVLLSVPDGYASLAVAQDLIGFDGLATHTVIDLSTIGIAAAERVHETLAAAGVRYIDAPVSGGVAGARAATLTVMWAGPAELLERHRPVLAALARNIFHVGERPGQGQALKLLNNFLSATALAATSEAVLFGQAQGLDLKTIIDVVNVSTGRNTATSDKFPNRILSGTFDAGFSTALMHKDLSLYMESARQASTPAAVGAVVDELWQRLDATLPGSDISEIYTWLREVKKP